MFDPLAIPHIWRAQSLTASAAVLSTGFAALDDAIGGGWPAPALVEILTDVYGIGELQVVLPLLRTLANQPPQPALIAWWNPPYEPNAVALAQHGLGASQHWLGRNLSARDTLWSMEQALKSQACSVALAWITRPDTTSLRRLRLAITSSQRFGILYRPSADATMASPAHVRLRLTPGRDHLAVTVLKAQGHRSGDLLLDVDARLRAEVKSA